MLQEYGEIVSSDIYPLSLHSDDFFDLLDGWLTKLDLGNDLPRDERTIRKSMSDIVADNPAFSALSDMPRFQSIKKAPSKCVQISVRSTVAWNRKRWPVKKRLTLFIP